MSLDADLSFDGAGPSPRALARQTADRPATAVDYAASTVTSRDAILDLKDDWQRLERISWGSTVFQAFDLCLPWLDAYVFRKAPTHQAHVLVFYDRTGQAIALAPLARKLGRFLSTAEWIGDPLVQYGDLLMDPAADKSALRTAFSKALGALPVSGLHLRNVRADARVAEVLDLSASAAGEPREALMVDLGRFEAPEDYFASLSKSARTNRKRKRRALEKRGALSFEVVPAGARAAELCKLALAWKSAWLDERGQSSRAFMDPRALDVLCAAIAHESPTNPFQIFVESIDGVPVTIEIGLVGPQGNAMFIASYDPAYDALSPGKVRIESIILHGFEQGWPLYDMLPPYMSYKKSWTNATLPVSDHLIPTSMAAKLYRDGYLRLARPILKRVWNVLPASLRTSLLRKSSA